jgi:hypothetical protein
MADGKGYGANGRAMIITRGRLHLIARRTLVLCGYDGDMPTHCATFLGQNISSKNRDGYSHFGMSMHLPLCCMMTSHTCNVLSVVQACMR